MTQISASSQVLAPLSQSNLQASTAQVSEVPIADQVPPALVEVSMDSRQDAGKGKEAEALQGKDKGKDKDKDKGKTSDTTISQPEQAVNPGTPKAQA